MIVYVESFQVLLQGVWLCWDALGGFVPTLSTKLFNLTSHSETVEFSFLPG